MRSLAIFLIIAPSLITAYLLFHTELLPKSAWFSALLGAGLGGGMLLGAHLLGRF